MELCTVVVLRLSVAERIVHANTNQKGAGMVDVSPEALNNPTLGAAVDLPFLDEIEAQDRENRSAKAEGRKPRILVKRDRFPGAQAGSWRTPPSNDTGVDFIDLDDEVIPSEGTDVAAGDKPNSGPESPNTSAG